MATVGSFSGKLVKIFQGDGGTPTEVFTAVACLTSNSIEITVNALEQACKDSGSWSEAAPDSKSATSTFDLLIKYDAAQGVDELWTDLNADTVRNWQLTTNSTGDPRWNFAAFISSYGESFDVGDFATASVTLTIVGAVTRDNVT